jgi:hypothetical protein
MLFPRAEAALLEEFPAGAFDDLDAAAGSAGAAGAAPASTGGGTVPSFHIFKLATSEAL